MEKKYIVIKDYQGGEFGMYRALTAEEWGEEAYSWAFSDNWDNPKECLLENFKNEENLINFIQEMWEIELVELNKNNEKVMEFLEECKGTDSEKWAKEILKELGVIKMKIYVVYQLGYTGSNVLEILGVYNNIGEAKKVYLQNIEENINEYDFDYDKECKLVTLDKEGKHNMTRLFKGGYQENWDNYLEIHIQEKEVE